MFHVETSWGEKNRLTLVSILKPTWGIFFSEKPKCVAGLSLIGRQEIPCSSTTERLEILEREKHGRTGSSLWATTH